MPEDLKRPVRMGELLLDETIVDVRAFELTKGGKASLLLSTESGVEFIVIAVPGERLRLQLASPA